MLILYPSMFHNIVLSKDYMFWIGDGANAVPINKNYALELPTFGVIAEVNLTVVQWWGLALGEQPCWSLCHPGQVSMKTRKTGNERRPKSWKAFNPKSELSSYNKFID